MSKNISVVVLALIGGLILFVGLFYSLFFAQQLENEETISKTDEVLVIDASSWALQEINQEAPAFEVDLSFYNQNLTLIVCNQIGYGKADVTAKFINFHDQPFSTLMYCEDEALNQLEADLITMLSKPMRYTFDPQQDSLTVFDEENVLTFAKIQ